MEVLINILTSICVCSVFMYWYEKRLEIDIKTLMQEMENISIEAIEQAKSQNINEILDRFGKFTNNKRSRNEWFKNFWK